MTYLTENLLSAKDMKRNIEVEGHKIEIRPITVQVDQIARAAAVTAISKFDIFKEIFALKANISGGADIGQALSLDAMQTALREENTTQLVYRCSFKAGTNELFFADANTVRGLAPKVFTQIEQELVQLSTFSPSTMDMNEEKFEELYKDFKKKELNGTMYSREELEAFSLILVDKCEVQKEQLERLSLKPVKEDGKKR